MIVKNLIYQGKNLLIFIQPDMEDVKSEEEQIAPLPPPGSPPPNLPQPTLKNPDKYIVNQLIYFHYNINTHEMYVSPYPYPTHNVAPPPQQISSIPQHQITQTPPTGYTFNKSAKSNRISNSKFYHSTHKPIHNSSEANLIVLSNSPLNI